MNQKKPLKPIIISAVAFVLIVIVIAILNASGIFHKNPFGPSTRIDNFRSYFREVNIDTYDAVTSALYDIIDVNTPDDETIPTNGALIRKDSVNSEYNEAAFTTQSTFLVDIESVQQTYRISMTWSNNPDAFIGGYPVLITCPAENQLIYPAFECKDLLTIDPSNKLHQEYPFLDIFPLQTAYYENNFSNYVSYKISYRMTDDFEDITLVINDYTGGNYDRALNELREYNIDPAKFKIEYVDDSSYTEIPARAEE